MNDIQERILLLLVEIDTICRSNGIEYYLEGGSVLGAVRHGGFLPWDDDADITMTRKNWEKFRRAVKKENRPDRILESPEENEYYPTVTMRYVDTTSTRLWRSLMLDVCACGIAIDIFVLEPAPDDERLEQMKMDLIDYCEYINRYYRISSLGDSRRYRKLRRKEIFLGRKKIADRLNRKLTCYDENSCHLYLMRWAFRFQVYEREMFGTPQYVKFENVMLPIPENVYEYLDYQYGADWYMIPDEEHIDTHDTILDISTGYKTYVDTYMPLINKRKALKINQRYKDLEMKTLNYSKAYHRQIYSASAIGTAYITNRNCRKYTRNLSETFSNITPETKRLFSELFGDYLQKQLNNWFLFFEVFVPLEDKYIALVMTYLLRTGQLSQLDKLLTIRKKQPEAPSSEIIEIELALNNSKRSVAQFWAGETVVRYRNSVKSPIQTAAEICSDLIYSDCIDYDEIECRLISLMNNFENEDLFKVAYAVLLLRKGNDYGNEILRYLEETTKNGMIVQWIKQNRDLQGC